MVAFEQAGGLFHVRYRAKDDLSPWSQGKLLQAVRQHSKRLPVGLLFELDAGITAVDPSVPKFWLQTLDDESVRIVGMAVMSDAKAVRMATDAFNMANILRRKPVAVRSFGAKELAQAQTWLVEQIHSATADP